ncbi:MAG: hypothetical protein NTY13_02265 [Chlamydiae bacterium]|nr:hypothetical protein [Chlamydiota bacterium]
MLAGFVEGLKVTDPLSFKEGAKELIMSKFAEVGVTFADGEAIYKSGALKTSTKVTQDFDIDALVDESGNATKDLLPGLDNLVAWVTKEFSAAGSATRASTAVKTNLNRAGEAVASAAKAGAKGAYTLGTAFVGIGFVLPRAALFAVPVGVVALGKAFGTGLGWIGSKAMDGLSFVKNGFDTLLTKIAEKLGRGGSDSAVTESWWSKNITPALEKIKQAITGLAPNPQGSFMSAVNKVLGFFESVKTGVVNSVGKGYGLIDKSFKEGVEFLFKKNVDEKVEAVESVVTGVVESLREIKAGVTKEAAAAKLAAAWQGFTNIVKIGGALLILPAALALEAFQKAWKYIAATPAGKKLGKGVDALIGGVLSAVATTKAAFVAGWVGICAAGRKTTEMAANLRDAFVYRGKNLAAYLFGKKLSEETIKAFDGRLRQLGQGVEALRGISTMGGMQASLLVSEEYKALVKEYGDLFPTSKGSAQSQFESLKARIKKENITQEELEAKFNKLAVGLNAYDEKLKRFYEADLKAADVGGGGEAVPEQKGGGE